MITHPVIERRRAPWRPTDISSTVLYLPLYSPMLFGGDGATFISRDAYGHLCTVTGALWTQQGRDFDGLDDLILVPAAPSLTFAGNTISVEFWARRDSISVRADVINKVDRAFISFLANDRIQFSFRQVDSPYTYRAVSSDVNAVIDTGWHYIVVTFARPVVAFYVDGVAWGTGTLDYAMMDDSAQDLQISEASDTLDGMIGEVRLHRGRALVAGRVQYNYDVGKWRYR